MKIEANGELYGYLFHYNHYRKMWYAIPREEIVDYWNGTSANCISHSDLNELVTIVFENNHDISDN